MLDQSKTQRQRLEIPNVNTEVSLFTLCMLRFTFLHRINEIQLTIVFAVFIS